MSFIEITYLKYFDAKKVIKPYIETGKQQGTQKKTTKN